jgi:hypothetical protein
LGPRYLDFLGFICGPVNNFGLVINKSQLF